MLCKYGQPIKLGNNYCPHWGEKLELNQVMIDLLLEEDACEGIRAAITVTTVAAIGTGIVGLFSIWGNGLFSIVFAIFLFALLYGMAHYKRFCFVLAFFYSVAMGFMVLYNRDDYGKFFIPMVFAYVVFISVAYWGMEGAFEYHMYKVNRTK